jgi:ESCRT-II complex subunit VPS25
MALGDAREMVEFMRKEGRAEWIGRGEERNVAWVWWRNPEEWAGAIAEWVEETGQKNTVLTLYELTESEATVSQGKYLGEKGRDMDG